jgi:RNA recognition motif-containing protein
VFVNNLAWATGGDELKAAFASFNPVSATVATRADGRSRGWGTVQFSRPEDATSAVERMKGHDIDGRNVEVLIDKKA